MSGGRALSGWGVASPDVAVIGAGVVGCSVAYHLSATGARVLVLEREGVASGASGGSAGMLAPQVEAEAPGPFLDLALRSRELHPALAAALQEETGWDVGLDMRGILRVAQTEDGAAELRARASWQGAAGLTAEWLDARGVQELVPGLDGVHGGLLVPDGQVAAPRLTTALAEAAVLRGAEIRQGVAATGLLPGGGVGTTDGPILAGAVVICAGPWSGLFDLGPACPVRPVKGQLLHLRALPRQPGLPVFGDGCYLVPKAQGRVLVGATMEEAGFDRRVTLGAVAALASAASRLLPAFGQVGLAGAWAGLRPATPDGLPLIGRVPGHERVYLSTGHFRNGVLLAPLTGRLVAALVAGNPPEVDLTPFDPCRFQPEPGLLD